MALDLPIVLIGPICSGKSTLAQLLADSLGLKRYELDEQRWDYYEEIGYDKEIAQQIVESERGRLGLLQYWKPFEAHAVERVVTEYQDGVIDFGAGHSVYENASLFSRVQQALTPLRNIIFLLPSEDLVKSTMILNQRFAALLKGEGIEVDEELLEVNKHFVNHPSNHLLATVTIYTQGRSPEETCREIINSLR